MAGWLAGWMDALGDGWTDGRTHCMTDRWWKWNSCVRTSGCLSALSDSGTQRLPRNLSRISRRTCIKITCLPFHNLILGSANALQTTHGLISFKFTFFNSQKYEPITIHSIYALWIALVYRNKMTSSTQLAKHEKGPIYWSKEKGSYIILCGKLLEHMSTSILVLIRLYISHEHTCIHNQNISNCMFSILQAS